MKIIHDSPAKSLSKIYLRQSSELVDIMRFQTNTQALLDGLEGKSEDEREETLKTLIRDFLVKTWYQDYYVTPIGDLDLAIGTGPKRTDPIGVIIETKRPGSKDFPDKKRQNVKALHQLLWYYMAEREAGNNQVRHLIMTDGWQWYLLDENWFDRYAWHNAALLADYRRYVADKRTDDFYRDVAQPFFEGLSADIPATYFDLRDYSSLLSDSKLYEPDHARQQLKVTSLYKILSPEHLLGLTVGNDSNTLNRAFYTELLHIMGLEEVKEGNKLVIKRLAEGKRNSGSLIELAIYQIENRNRLRAPHANRFYDNEGGDDRLFAIGMELVITWINRILFIKLLEGQLITVHRDTDAKQRYLLLHIDSVRDFDELAKLFFDVLARKRENRTSEVMAQFGHIPYLNSSLFEESPLEEQVLGINQLDNQTLLSLHPSTILKDHQHKPQAGGLKTLDYVFRFLDAYDFGSEGSGEIKPSAKTLINASVLGLIFEKINGYKEGSIYTPGYITMYMCRESIRRALVQKFNDRFGWKAQTFEDLCNHLTGRSTKDVLAYNQVANSLTICDPAVGSGHFLVSALNELIACKGELGILADQDGRLIKGWQTKVENDELLLIDDEGILFGYAKQPSGGVAQDRTRIQQTLFQEKQLLIENCIFGVDINPNSVKICRLRLWIELLKHAYYTPESNYQELETLPNIDINIKTGNSLVSRFSLKEDLSDVFRSQRFSLSTYRDAVQAYKKTRSREAKDELIRFLRDIQDQYQQTRPTHQET